jgi:hypothetical protein
MPSLLTAVLFVGLSSATSYDASISKRFVYYSAATYCEESTLLNWDCGPACDNEPGLIHVTPIGDATAGTFSYVAYNTILNEVEAAWSHNLENWISNIDFASCPVPPVESRCTRVSTSPT